MCWVLGWGVFVAGGKWWGQPPWHGMMVKALGVIFEVPRCCQPAMDHGKNSGSNVAAAAHCHFVSDQGHDMKVAKRVNSVLSFVRVHSP